MEINGYILKSELNNANSGFSKWGFAFKNGREYFIKELLNPVFPMDRESMSMDMFVKRRQFCVDYEERSKAMYHAINCASRGDLVRIKEFFRCGSKYYIVMDKVAGDSIPSEEVCRMSDVNKLLLMKTAAYALMSMHKAGLVHFDIKPSNILIKRTRYGKPTAKIIDFDAGFFHGEDISDRELGGDLTYLAPETFLALCGEGGKPDKKCDIFSLGLVFHEYWCGFLPAYDENEYDCPCTASLSEGTLGVYKNSMPDKIGDLIESMLNSDPAERPDAVEIVNVINEILGAPEVAEAPVIPVEVPVAPVPVPVSAVPTRRAEDWFTPAGDL